MRKNIPVYEISIDINDPNTGVQFNALVHDPAHEISFQTFSKEIERFQFNDEEQIVTGVAISADTLIPRSQNGKEFYVVFRKDGIKDIIHDYARKGLFNNVNIEHNSSDVAKGVYMIHSYQVDNDKGFTAPERFKTVNDGSWITSYKFENTELYNKVKSGEFRGFSVEGMFVLDEMKFSKDDEIDTLLDEIIEKLNTLTR